MHSSTTTCDRCGKVVAVNNVPSEKYLILTSNILMNNDPFRSSSSHHVCIECGVTLGLIKRHELNKELFIPDLQTSLIKALESFIEAKIEEAKE